MKMISLTEYDGYKISARKTRVNIEDIVSYNESTTSTVTYVTIRGCSAIKVLETPDVIDKLIAEQEQPK